MSEYRDLSRATIGLNRLEVKQRMANNTSGGNRINVPQAKGALDNMKYEIARDRKSVV